LSKLTRLFTHLVSGIAVVVTPDGNLLIIDELFVYVQLFKDALLHLFANSPLRASVVGDVNFSGSCLNFLRSTKKRER
jgi:hypothetical protein